MKTAVAAADEPDPADLDRAVAESVMHILRERQEQSEPAAPSTARIFGGTPAALREVLVRMACPVVCRGTVSYLADGVTPDPAAENWHLICETKADAALAALGRSAF